MSKNNQFMGYQYVTEITRIGLFVLIHMQCRKKCVFVFDHDRDVTSAYYMHGVFPIL